MMTVIFLLLSVILWDSDESQDILSSVKINVWEQVSDDVNLYDWFNSDNDDTVK